MDMRFAQFKSALCFLFCSLVFIFYLMTCSASAEETKLAQDALPKLSSDQTQLLDDIQKKALNYFIHERASETGLIKDWAWNKPINSDSLFTVAGAGFALTAYGVGVEHGWLDRGEALEMTKIALRFLRDQAPNEHGFFYHFMNEKGNPAKGTELSPIDTTLAVTGVLFASQYFDDSEITSLANDIFNRIDWPWMLNGGKTFAMAWFPRNGFQKNRWTNYDESTLMYILALGSPTYPISAESWHAVNRRIGSYKSHRLIQSPPLFTHQYPHIWIDFRNKNDGFADYFENSRQATLAHRQFAIDHSDQFKSYGPNSWGLTAAEGPSGYKAYGAPPGWVNHDGTVAPTACVSSIAFTPDESIACIEHMRRTYPKLWGRYGFSDSFNVERNWYSGKVFAINQGPMISMIENYRSNLIWKVMNQSPVIKQGLEKAGFREGTINLKWEEPPTIQAPFVAKPILIDGDTYDWPKEASVLKLNGDFLETGEVSDDRDLSAQIRFAWDAKYLYFVAEVRDDSNVFVHAKGEIWHDDLLELFIDPDGNGLDWYKPSDFQLGFRPEPRTGEVKTWSWFQGGKDPTLSKQVFSRSYVHEGGYTVEGRIEWDLLHIAPQAGQVIRLTPAIHDADQDKSEGKITWFFRNEEEQNRYELGRLILS